ncbi:MAG TPA: class I SAM-dependent methyltransferase [Fimbriimonadaceae bacterium]|nr:class I SAM-dependent methyltransferase [Fimbriimonadaceae bacterium]
MPGWFDFADLYDLAVAEASHGSKFLEIGCWLGKSTCYLADQVRRSKKSVLITVIDTFKGVPGDELQELLGPYGGSVRTAFEKNLEMSGVRDLVSILEENSAAAHHHFAPQSLDFIFIDADHSYPAVKRDIRNFLPKVKPGGILAGHDYGHSPQVRRAVDEALGPCPASASSWAYRVR